MSNRISGLSEISQNFDGILCDVWGVLHNGQEVFQHAARALAEFRAEGRHVVMITNSPRPHQGVIQQLDELGVSQDVYDGVVTSGDATRILIDQNDGPVWHLGAKRDLPIFEGLDVELTDPEQCSAIVCTGLFDDETEQPEDYRTQLEPLVARDIPLICANPDIVVHRGNKLIFCAGALAQLYAEMGGQTRVAGKPHKPIYELATVKMTEIAGRAIAKERLLAIGDGMPTDVAGAQNNGFNLLYISAGIHFSDYGEADNPDEVALAKFLKANGATPNAWMPRLVWDKVA